MKQFFDALLGRRAATTGLVFPNLPESVAYSAFLASGVEGAGELSFAQFVATRRHAPCLQGHDKNMLVSLTPQARN